MTRTVVQKFLLLSALAGLASGACQQSNESTGTQSSGAEYVLFMPESSCWNHNLVVFAHGYVAPGQPLGITPDEYTVGGVSLATAFNQLGYAFAASSFSKNGLAIVQGFNDTLDLVQNILDPLLRPQHVYVTGVSEGGLIATLSAEQLQGVYVAAEATCGPIGTFQGQLNYFGDFRVIFDYFFPGVIPGNVTNIPPEVQQDWFNVYVPKIESALSSNQQATSQLINVLRAPVTSDPNTIPETVLNALAYDVFGFSDAATTLGGQPYDNHRRQYSGSSNDTALNQNVQRYTASSVALQAVDSHYETSGRLKMPIVTLHTTVDPVVPYWQETRYTDKTEEAGTSSLRTNQRVSTYGHCTFSSSDFLNAFSAIVQP